MALQRLEGLAGRALLLQRFDSFVFDCDGVLWCGPQLLDGADAFVRALQEADKACIFVTNNSTKTTAQFQAKFRGFGMEVPARSCVSSAEATCRWLRREGIAPGGRCYVLGEPGLHAMLREAGVETLGEEDVDKRFEDCAGLTEATLERNIDAVVCALDSTLNYYKLAKASALIRFRGARFLSTNRDAASPLFPGAFIVPGGGMTAAAVEGATGVSPVVMGKPSQDLAAFLKADFGLEPGRTLMVGDRLDTDVQFGVGAGFSTLLVESGVTGPALVEQLERGQEPAGTPRPTFVAASLGALV